ncbi:MAG: murein L,D-transpeptidase [Alphaproteobacteria bacterium]|nr:murein L,D-transpeptidase [Alphaproteobacteria bacterium]
MIFSRKKHTLAAIFLVLGLLSACAPMTPEQKVNLIRARKWPALKEEIVAQGLEPGAPLYIRIFKQEGILETWLYDPDNGSYEPFKTYPICAMAGALGPKVKQGDKQAPEGFYSITPERLWPGSRYHLAMNVGYPNPYDLAQGRTGDKLMIHGDCKSEGCFAMTDPLIEDIYLLTEQSLRRGQAAVPVHIFPFRMSAENLSAVGSSPSLPFWLNLKEGYDAFEMTRLPTPVAVEQGRYVFECRPPLSSGPSTYSTATRQDPMHPEASGATARYSP